MQVDPTLEEFLASDSLTFAATGKQFLSVEHPKVSTLFFWYHSLAWRILPAKIQGEEHEHQN
jgi:hypothetical protein